MRFVQVKREAIAAVKERRWDVALFDARHPMEDVFETSQRLRKLRGDLRVLFFGDSVPIGWVARAVYTGASGFLGKCASVEEVRMAILSVMEGQAYFSPCAAKIVSALAARSFDFPAFTPCEWKVLHHVCEGLSSKEMAKALLLTTKGVDAIRARLMRKSGTTTAAALVKFVYCEHLIEPHPRFEPTEPAIRTVRRPAGGRAPARENGNGRDRRGASRR